MCMMILVIPVRVEDDSNSVKSPKKKKKKTKSMFADSKKIISTLKTRCLISINCTPKNSHSSLKKWDSKKNRGKKHVGVFSRSNPMAFPSFLSTHIQRQAPMPIFHSSEYLHYPPQGQVWMKPPWNWRIWVKTHEVYI